MALKKHNPGCQCCGGDPCTRLQQCLGLVQQPSGGWRTTKSFEVQLPPFTPGPDCADCSEFAIPILFPVPINTIGPCTLIRSINLPIAPCGQIFRVDLRIDTQQVTIQLFNVGWGVFYRHIGYPQTLCDTGQIEVPFLNESIFVDFCTVPSSPAILRMF